jgi:hypothetical protein
MANRESPKKNDGKKNDRGGMMREERWRMKDRGSLTCVKLPTLEI